jgi:hypothetical protein
MVALTLAGCSDDFLAPRAAALAGTWRLETDASLSGNSWQTIFTADGQVTTTWTSRGGYAGVPADSVTSYSIMFGHYSVTSGRLHESEDSTLAWDQAVGFSRRIGSPLYVEGPPTDSDIHVTRNQLVLENEVNAGAGYTRVRRVFDRQP